MDDRTTATGEELVTDLPKSRHEVPMQLSEKQGPSRSFVCSRLTKCCGKFCFVFGKAKGNSSIASCSLAADRGKSEDEAYRPFDAPVDAFAGGFSSCLALEFWGRSP